MVTWKRLVSGLSSGKWFLTDSRSYLSRKMKKMPHPSLVFNNNNVLQAAWWTFDKHLNNVLNNVNKTVGLLGKLQNLLSRLTLITIYKAFVRPHLHYGDILYDQTDNSSFHEKLKSTQYNACLTLTGAIRGSSKEKIYQELGFKSLGVRGWYRKLCLFYKVLNN